MDEEILTPTPTPEDGQQPKKRGRKPRVQRESDAPDASSEKTLKPAKKRGRPKKAKSEDFDFPRPAESADGAQNAEQNVGQAPASSGPTWRDVPETPSESYTPENEIFTGTENSDDFEYSRSRRDSADADDSEVPQYFSTSDDDLDPDAYRNNVRDEEPRGENFGEQTQKPAPAASAFDEEPDPIADPTYESFAEAEAARQDRRNNRKNWKQNGRDNFRNNRQQQQNNQRQNGRDNNNFGNNNRQQRNQQQNRQQQNNQRQQNNQQNRQQQQGGARQQQQQQRNQQQQKKQIWKPSETDADAMNPADLTDWAVLKSQEAISNWLAEKFDFPKPETSAETPVVVAEVGAQPAENPETPLTADDADKAPEAAATEPQAAELSAPAQAANEPEAQPEIHAPTAPEDMSYWELLAQSSDSRIERTEKPSETEAQAADNAPAQPAVSATDTAESANTEAFEEDATYALPDGSKIESVSGYEDLCPLHIKELKAKFAQLAIPVKNGAAKCEILAEFFRNAAKDKKLVSVHGALDVFEGGLGGVITFASDNYALKNSSVYVPQFFIEKYALKRGHILGALAAAPREGERENCPFAVKITSVMGGSPDAAAEIIPFTDLVPYYPTRRIILESAAHNAKENLSMRAVDLLTPIGFGQRALIVAPPRTGKTVLMQSIAKSIRINNPDAKLIILLVDERPEEVTDFRRAIDAEVVASTFDQDATSHVHAAEMVISRARRMVEGGEDVVILLDSITRLARAYNALMPNGGRTMSGGVEANALQKPKKFFGSARNIEGGGSLTIIGTALIETGSKMDEVIFEEFKGTGNLELDLDRSLSDKRIFPAINIEKSGTRKEELLYHPDELTKIYTLRRAMKGIPAADAMEMLIQRLKKVKTNVEFLLGLNR